MKMILELDVEEADIISQVLNKFAATRKCPPGCIVAAEVAMRIDRALPGLRKAVSIRVGDRIKWRNGALEWEETVYADAKLDALCVEGREPIKVETLIRNFGIENIEVIKASTLR